MTTSVGLLLGGLALFLLTRAAVLRLRKGRRNADCHPVDVAYLVGGPEHALLVAAVDLHRQGVLRPVSRAQGVRLTREEVLRMAPSGCAVDEAATPECPLERALVRVLAAEPGRPLLNKRLRTAPEMIALHEHLIRLGLLVNRRTAWLIRLSALWPIVLVGIGPLWIDAAVEGTGAWLSIAAAAGVPMTGTWFGVPTQTPAARRAIKRAAAHRHEAAEMLTKRLASVGFGTDDPELREVGVEPMVVAAHGSIVLWSADPLLAVALGDASPRSRRRSRLHADAPLHGSPLVDYALLSDGGLN